MEPEENLEPEKPKKDKLDKDMIDRLKKSTNLTDSEIAQRYEDFNKMFPEKKGTKTRPLEKLIFSILK